MESMYDPASNSLIITVPLENITPPSKDESTGVPAKHAMIHSGARSWGKLADTDFGPIHGTVQVGIPVEAMPDLVCEALGIDKAAHVQARLRAGQSITRTRAGAVPLAELIKPKPQTAADKLKAAQAAVNKGK